MPRIVELVKTRIPKRFGLDPVRDIQVLCPMNRGGVGARSLNIELQEALNPAGERKVERFGWTFAPGDKVMQIENDYDKEVYNGDIGYIDDVDPDTGELTASFDGRAVAYGFGELDTLVPAYAATIHKSQGSEYPAVVIPVMTQHYAMLQRNLLYTGVTRGKRLVVLVGQKKAVAIAVRNVSGTTALVEAERMAGQRHAAEALPGARRITTIWERRRQNRRHMSRPAIADSLRNRKWRLKPLNAKNLEALGAARLAELLAEISAGNAAAKRRLRLELAAAQSPGDVAKEVRKRLTTIGRSRSFVDWQGVRLAR